jgi:hypothetical protein
VILIEKVAVVPAAAGRGLIGILKVSFQSGIIDHDFVHVTTLHTNTQHDQPLSINGLLGPTKFAGIVNEPVVVHVDDAFHALVTTTGRREVWFTVNDGVG